MFRSFSRPSSGWSETSLNYIVASSWHFALFHVEDAGSNDPQTVIILLLTSFITTTCFGLFLGHHQIDRCLNFINFCSSYIESNENLKYILSRNLSKTKATQWLHFFLCSLHDPWLISRCAAISFPVIQLFSYTLPSTGAIPSGVTTGCAWTSRGQSVTELMPFMNCLVHWYTCCTDRHASPYWTFIGRWISMCFIPSLLKNG